MQVSIDKGVEIEEKIFGGCFETHLWANALAMPWPIVPAPIIPTLLMMTYPFSVLI